MGWRSNYFFLEFIFHSKIINQTYTSKTVQGGLNVPHHFHYNSSKNIGEKICSHLCASTIIIQIENLGAKKDIRTFRLRLRGKGKGSAVLFIGVVKVYSSFYQQKKN
jgi:hypothetical protein